MTERLEKHSPARDTILPNGWAKVPIRNVCFLINGRAFSPSEWTTSGLPIVRIQNLNNPSAIFNYCDEKIDEKFHIDKGELLFAWSGTPGTSFGAHIWKGGRALLNQHIFRVLFDELLIDKKFFRLALNDRLNSFISKAHGGVGLRHITKSKFEETEILFPPLAEQDRIATKVEALLNRVDSVSQRLAKGSAGLKHLRQAILAHAFSGRLTEDWREKHSKYEHWKQVDFFDFCILQRGYDLPIKKCKPGPYPVVSSGGIVARHSEFKAKGPGVTVGRSGSTGKVHYVDEDFWPHNTSLFVKDFKGNLPKYVYYFLLGFSFQRFSASTAVPTLNRNTLRGVKVKVPPVDEQAEIIRQVERLFELADKIETRIKQASDRVDKLTQSILAKAFIGELVPTEAELAKLEGRGYETAKKLLDRIAKAKSTEANDKEKKQMKRQLSIKHKKQPVRYPLLEVIRKNPEGITPENLLRIANYTIEEIDDFYCDLSNILQEIEEVKPSGSQAKKWLINNNVLIKPKKV